MTSMLFPILLRLLLLLHSPLLLLLFSQPLQLLLRLVKPFLLLSQIAVVPAKWCVLSNHIMTRILPTIPSQLSARYGRPLYKYWSLKVVASFLRHDSECDSPLLFSAEIFDSIFFEKRTRVLIGSFGLRVRRRSTNACLLSDCIGWDHGGISCVRKIRNIVSMISLQNPTRIFVIISGRMS